MFYASFGIKLIYLHHKQTVKQTVESAVINTHITFSNDFLHFFIRNLQN